MKKSDKACITFLNSSNCTENEPHAVEVQADKLKVQI